VKSLARARAGDSLQAFSKLTRVVSGTPRIVSDPPLVVPVSELYPREAREVRQSLADVIRGYRRTLSSDRQHLLEGYRFMELARKVVGVGSVGTRSWILLFLGRDSSDSLFLQAKEAEASVLEPFAGSSVYRDHGERVVSGQRLMQAVSDIFLGWQRVQSTFDGKEHHYYVRQLRDWKWSPDIGGMPVSAMKIWGRLCAWTLARAHARSGDCIAIAAYIGQGDTLDRALAAFAESYADQNERDYAVFKKAVKAGRIKAATGV